MSAAVAGALLMAAAAPVSAEVAPPFEQTANWEFDRTIDGEDHWGSNDLTFQGEHSWGVDRWNTCFAAYVPDVDESGWAQTAGPVVDLQGPFSIAAWARVDDLEADGTIVAQPGFALAYSAEAGTFRFSMARNDSEHAPPVTAVAQEPAAMNQSNSEFGDWYHLAVQVDRNAGLVRLYVDGALQDEVRVSHWSRHADGPLTIGAAAASGGVTDGLSGAVDDVRVWSGVLDEQVITDLSSDRPQFPSDPGDAGCVEDDEPPVIDP